MANDFKMKGAIRAEKAGAVRRRGFLPAVMYGRGIDAQALELDLKKFLQVYREAGSTTLVTLEVAGDKGYPVLIRELQMHPVNNNVLHVDLYQVRMDEEIHANVAVHFVGESIAVKDLGGILVRNLDEIEVKALPQNLPHDIEVDISVMKNFDAVISIKDLNLGEGVEILGHEPDDIIALIQAPRTQDEIDEELSAEVAEDVESVEGVKDKPEEGEESEEGEPAAEEKKE